MYSNVMRTLKAKKKGRELVNTKQGPELYPRGSDEVWWGTDMS